VGTQPVDEYCREIETYLTRKNDGHLIRVVGPSFELVSRWAAGGVPIKVAFEGIDRYFERYYRKGPRRRPVKIDFCEADVLDVFDEWRRALGLTAAAESGGDEPTASPPDTPASKSLPAHLERALLRLTDVRTGGAWDDRAGALDELIDRTAGELEAARASRGGLRGQARLALTTRLSVLDTELLGLARAALSPGDLSALERQAEQDIDSFRDRLRPDAFRTAAQAALDRLIRVRFGLPTLKY
jgi:hypothetical protein